VIVGVAPVHCVEGREVVERVGLAVQSAGPAVFACSVGLAESAVVETGKIGFVEHVEPEGSRSVEIAGLAKPVEDTGSVGPG